MGFAPTAQIDSGLVWLMSRSPFEARALMETPTAEKWRGWGAIAVLLTELTALADQRIRTIERSDGMRRATAQMMRCGKARICSEVWLGHSHHRIEFGQ